MGISHLIPDGITLGHLVRAALAAPNPFPNPAPIPTDIDDSIPYIGTLRSEEPRFSRRSQLNSLRRTGDLVSIETRPRYTRAPVVLRRSAGVFDASLAFYLSRGFGMRAENWIAQMIYGFPSVG